MRRRAFLTRTSVLAVAPLLERGGPATAATAPAPPRAPEALDQALERLAGTGPEYYGGLANHGPMAAEALVRLGRSEAVGPWVEDYRKKLQDALTASRPVTEADWHEALGDFRRAGDWAALFDAALKEAPWTDVLRKWTPRLAPGLSAAACHGLIRAGQAARSLAEHDLPARRAELAQGLAYWAARYQALPEKALAPGKLAPSEALRRVPVLPPERRGRGLISEALAGLAEVPSFAEVADLVDANAPGLLSALTETFAGVYLAQAHPGSRIAFIHAVTGPSAVRLLLPHLSPEAGPLLLRYAWQVAAAVYAGYAGPSNPGAEAKPWSRDELIDRAVATGDEHAFKFTEACLREHALSPMPVYLAAAQRNVEATSS
jgi:hypothetical protein